ncbi:hypothetical protein ACTWP5_24550 [Streptomyces sp. 4N509B]|uniref:hypothetical protein n=1 Tax=Streptomyces sp. 4N509B TaxID=3457413 RepID=UPI003FD42EDB
MTRGDGGAARTAPRLRLVLGLAGLALMGVGAWVLLVDAASRTPGQVAVWLAGALVVHDAVLVPLVLLVGVALRRLPYRRVRHVVRGGLLVAGCVTLLALPPLLRPGTPRNETELPLDYPRNLLLVLAAVAVVTALAVAWAWWAGRGGRAGRAATPGSGEEPRGRVPG